MVKETVAIAWKDMSIHLVPELPTSVDDKIKRLSPGWEINRDDQCTLLKNQRVYVASDSRETRAICIREYGGNLPSIRSIGNIIKNVATVSKRKDVPEKLAESVCGIAITCEALPIEVRPIGTFSYTPYPEKNLIVIAYRNNFHSFSNNFYKHVFAKAFTFK